MTHKRSACKHQVGTSRIERFINKEIFLLPTQIGMHMLHIRVEVLGYCSTSLVNTVQCSQQRSLIVERLASVSNKDCWNTKGIVYDERWRRNVPCRISSCLKRVANATVREARCIWLLLHKQLACKLFNHTAFAIMLDKRVMLFGCAISQRMKPVCVMLGAIIQRPLFHTGSHAVSNFSAKGLLIVNRLGQCLKCLLRKIFKHFLTVEHSLTIILRRFLLRDFHLYRLSVKSLLNYFES